MHVLRDGRGRRRTRKEVAVFCRVVKWQVNYPPIYVLGEFSEFILILLLSRGISLPLLYVVEALNSLLVVSDYLDAVVEYCPDSIRSMYLLEVGGILRLSTSMVALDQWDL